LKLLPFLLPRLLERLHELSFRQLEQRLGSLLLELLLFSLQQLFV
jgi:hypothetical protein